MVVERVASKTYKNNVAPVYSIMSNLARLCAVKSELRACFAELAMLQSSCTPIRAARHSTAAEYIQGVIGSIHDRSGNYPAEATINIMADLRLCLVELGDLVVNTTPVNSGGDMFPTDDKQFIVKVMAQLRLAETAQIQAQPQAARANLTAKFAEVVRLFRLFSDAIDRRRDHLRERQAERARAAARVANGEGADSSDDDDGD